MFDRFGEHGATRTFILLRSELRAEDVGQVLESRAQGGDGIGGGIGHLASVEQLAVGDLVLALKPERLGFLAALAMCSRTIVAQLFLPR